MPCALPSRVKSSRHGDPIRGVKMRRLGIIMLSLIALTIRLSLTSADAAATSPAGRHKITGTVKDAIGRPLPGVRLSLQTSEGKAKMKAQSAADGHFTFAGVAPGVYAVVAEKASFKTATAIVTVTARGVKPLEMALESEAALSMAVVAKRLDKARNGLSP